MAKEIGYTPVNIFAACCGALASALALANPVTAAYAGGISVAISAVVGGIQLNEKEKSIKDKLSKAMDSEWDRIRRDYRLTEECLAELKDELIGESTSVAKFVRNLENNSKGSGHHPVDDKKSQLVDNLRPVIIFILMKHKEELKKDPVYKWDSVFILGEARKIAVRIVGAIDSVLNNDDELKILVAIAEGRKADRREHKEIIDAVIESRDRIIEEYRKNSTFSAPISLTTIPKGVELIGRKDVIKVIREQLDQYDLVSIRADGGVGKTAVALEIANEVKKEITSGVSTFKHIAWITSSGDLNADSMSLHIPGVDDQKTLEDKVSVISSFLQQNLTFMLIDNMDTPPSVQEINLLNTISGETKILITSRVKTNKSHDYHLQTLDQQNAVRLFYKHYLDTSETLDWQDINSRSDKEYVDKIAETSYYNALLIELIAKMACWEYQDKLNALWERLEKDIFGTESEIDIEVDHHADHNKNGALSEGDLKLQGHIKSLYKLSALDKKKQEIMRFISLFPAETVLFSDAFRWAGFNLSDIKWLSDRGWIEKSGEGYLIHTIVKGSVKQQNGESVFNENEYTNLIRELADTNHYMPKDMNYSKVLERIIIPATVCELLMTSGSKTVNATILYNNIANVYYNQGQYDKALGYYDKAFTIREETLGVRSTSVATVYNNLANVYYDKGNYEDALSHYKKALEIWEKEVETEPARTATAYNNMANVYYVKGNYNDALEYYKKAKKIREEKCGTNHPDTASLYNNMAIVYSEQGNYENALEYYKMAKEIREEKLGTGHLDTAMTYNDMASMLSAQGLNEKALEYYEKAQPILEDVLGKEHPKTAMTYDGLAVVYSAQGQYDKAQEFFERARAILEKPLREVHPDTAKMYNDIASMYSAQGQYDKALKHYEKALDIREKVLGESHPHTKNTRDALLFVKMKLQ